MDLGRQGGDSLLRTLATLADDLCFVPTTHMALQPPITPDPEGHIPPSGFYGHCMHVMHIDQILIHIKQK